MIAETAGRRARTRRRHAPRDATVARRTARRAARSGAVWGAVFGLYVAIQALSYATSYQTERVPPRPRRGSSGRTRASARSSDPRASIDTVGGFTAWKCLTVLAITGSVWGLLTATKLLRGEEDAGRWELLLAGAHDAARRAAPRRCSGSPRGRWPSSWWPASSSSRRVGSPKLGFPATSAALLRRRDRRRRGHVPRVGALTSQALRDEAPGVGVRRGRRSARATRCAWSQTRAPGSDWLRWLTPLGWVEELQPPDEPKPVALVPIVALVARPQLARRSSSAGRRDLGGSVVPDRSTAQPRLGLLSSPVGPRAPAPAAGALRVVPGDRRVRPAAREHREVRRRCDHQLAQPATGLRSDSACRVRRPTWARDADHGGAARASWHAVRSAPREARRPLDGSSSCSSGRFQGGHGCAGGSRSARSRSSSAGCWRGRVDLGRRCRRPRRHRTADAARRRPQRRPARRSCSSAPARSRSASSRAPRSAATYALLAWSLLVELVGGITHVSHWCSTPRCSTRWPLRRPSLSTGVDGAMVVVAAPARRDRRRRALAARRRPGSDRTGQAQRCPRSARPGPGEPPIRVTLVPSSGTARAKNGIHGSPWRGGAAMTSVVGVLGSIVNLDGNGHYLPLALHQHLRREPRGHRPDDPRLRAGDPAAVPWAPIEGEAMSQDLTEVTVSKTAGHPSDARYVDGPAPPAARRGAAAGPTRYRTASPRTLGPGSTSSV